PSPPPPSPPPPSPPPPTPVAGPAQQAADIPPPPAAPTSTQPTAGAPTPGTPVGLTSSASGSTVYLALGGAGGGAAPRTYVIEAGAFPGSRDFVQATGDLATSFTADHVGNGTYFVRVRAANGAGMSAPSNEVIVTVDGGSGGSAPRSGAPGTPRGLLSQGVGSTRTLSWGGAGGRGVAQSDW